MLTGKLPSLTKFVSLFPFSTKKSSDNYYRILNVPPESDAETIKQSYLNLARKLHPDVNRDPQANAYFQAINEAYVVLSDESRRRKYNTEHGYKAQPVYNLKQGAAKYDPSQRSSLEDTFVKMQREAYAYRDETVAKSPLQAKGFKQYGIKIYKYVGMALLFSIIMQTVKYKHFPQVQQPEEAR